MLEVPPGWTALLPFSVTTWTLEVLVEAREEAPTPV